MKNNRKPYALFLSLPIVLAALLVTGCQSGPAEPPAEDPITGTKWTTSPRGAVNLAEAAAIDVELQFYSATEAFIRVSPQAVSSTLGVILPEGSGLNAGFKYRYNEILNLYECDFQTENRIHRITARVDWEQKLLWLRPYVEDRPDLQFYLSE